MAAMADQLIELFEGVLIEQKVKTFARGKFAFAVLLFGALRAAARFGACVTLLQFFVTVSEHEYGETMKQ